MSLNIDIDGGAAIIITVIIGVILIAIALIAFDKLDVNGCYQKIDCGSGNAIVKTVDKDGHEIYQCIKK